MRHLDLFSGIGGFALAARNVWGKDHELVAFCEIDKFCQKVLRKNFGEVPIIEDIKLMWTNPYSRRLMNGKKYVKKIGTINLLTGGFPCQPFSQAGQRKGNEDERALFPEMLRVIRETKPRWIVAENVNGILSIHDGEYFEEICTSLEDEGYTVQPYIIPASAVDTPHRRDRVWIIGYSQHHGCDGSQDEQSGNKGSDRNQKRADEICKPTGSNLPRGIATDTTRRETYTSKQERFYPKLSGKNRNASNTKVTKCEFSLNPRTRGEGFTNDNRNFADTMRSGCEEQHTPKITKRPGLDTWVLNPEWQRNWYEVATEFCVLDDGLPDRVAKLKGFGNAIVPQVAEIIFQAIKEIEERI